MDLNPLKRIETDELTAGVLGWTQSNRSSSTLPDVWRVEGWGEMGKMLKLKTSCLKDI